MSSDLAATRSDDAASSQSASAVLDIDNLDKSFDGNTVIQDFSISVYEGELLTLLGPSGCGKTTILRLIAGLERPDSGIVRLNGNNVIGDSFVSPEDRDVGIVFQDFALFPHLTIRENIEFGLNGDSATDRSDRVDELLDLVGLTDHDEKYPDALSGGQQQRVALARSLAPEPKLLLLDEPFSNLDVDLRVEMREEVRRILKEAGVTAVSVTHDQEEAMSISDRVAVMSDGNIQQIGTPESVFQRPTSRFVAGFLGHASFVTGAVVDGNVETGIGRVPIDRVNGLTTEYEGSEIDLMVRPDDVQARQPDGSEPANGELIHRRYLGATVLYRAKLDTGDIVACMHNHDDEVSLDDPVVVSLDADHELAWFPCGEQRMTDGGKGD